MEKQGNEMKTIQRQAYLDRLIAFKDKDLIKVITGIRRCGKSTLLMMYRDWLMAHGISEKQLICLNFEDFEYYDLRQPGNLYSYIKRNLAKGLKTYVFFDEIQHVENFPDIVNSLNLNPDIDMYITGSNAYMLSSEIATLLSGRYVEIPMLPLSFKEFAEAYNAPANPAALYSEYITRGSFPYVMELDGKNEISDYLAGIYDTVILKDVIARKRIPDIMMLESVVRFAADNIGNVLSTKKIADTMTANGRKIDQKTVERYISTLCETFVLYEAKRYNIKGKQFLKTLEKYYFVDMGLRRILLGTRAFDAGHILENVIYLELLRRYRRVYIGKVDNLEVDFVAMDNDEISYYQVAATVRDESTLRRELRPLQKINDHYRKYILTLDEDPDADYNGIIRTNALNWLLR